MSILLFQIWSCYLDSPLCSCHVQSIAEEVEEYKKQGNAEFTQGNYDIAIEFYTIALSICPESEKGLMSVIYQNRAAAYSKLVRHFLWMSIIFTYVFENSFKTVNPSIYDF